MYSFISRRLNLIVVILIMLIGIATLPSTALAHTRVEIGPYAVVVGWVEEPVIVGERNAILIEVTEDEAPVIGLEGTLDATVLYAGRSFIGNVSPSGTPGVYTVEIFPTVRGQYTVQLSGSIEDLEVDEQIQPEEVLGANVLQFPEVQPDAVAMQDTITQLEGQLQTAYTLAIVGIVVGVLGVVIAVIALFRRQKAS